MKEATDEDRIGTVKEIFSTITGKYDFLNHLLSLRRDIFWRRFAVRKMHFFQTHRFLDVATGTADLAIEAAKRHPNIEAFGIDFVQEMMDLGMTKIVKKHLLNRIKLLRGDALSLPFQENRFDVAGIAFGIRNIPDRNGALKEMTRVVVSGGQVMVLEMTFPTNGLLKGVYHLYLHRILPLIGRLFSRHPAAYHYLADSIRNFPTPGAFVKEMEEVGLIQVKKHSLDLGITYLHVGTKPKK